MQQIQVRNRLYSALDHQKDLFQKDLPAILYILSLFNMCTSLLRYSIYSFNYFPW